MLKAQIRSVLKYLLLLLIGVGLLWLAFRGVDLNSTWNELKAANMLWVGVSVLASLIAFASRAHRWNMLIRPTGYNPRFWITSYALMIGYLANLAVPRLGEVTRCGTLGRTEKIPFNVLVGTVIVERALDVLCLLVALILTAVLEYNRLGNFMSDNFFQPIGEKLSSLFASPLFYIFLAIVAGIALILFLNRRKSGQKDSVPFFQKIAHSLKGIVEGLRSVRKLNNPLAFLFHTILIWLMYFLMSYTCFFALEATSSLSMMAGLFVLVAGGMGMSAPVQGGIGAYHLLVSQGLLLYGISYEHGLVFATLMHTSQTLIVILLGALAFLLLSIAQKKSAHVNA